MSLTTPQPSTRVRVAVVSHDWSTMTGAGRCANELMDALSNHPRVAVVVGPGDLPNRSRGRLRVASKLMRGLAVFRILRARRAEVLVVNTTVQSSVVVAARLARTRVVWWCHESGIGLRGPLMCLRRAIYGLLCHEMVAVSRAVPPTRLPQHTIRNITANDHQTVISVSAPPTLLVLGSKSSIKGTDRLPALVDPGRLPRNARLAVVGWEDPRDAKLLSAAKASLQRVWGDRLIWHGPVDDPETLYATASVLLLPSRADSRPRVVEEALERGIPVVASDLPGLGEIAESTTDEHALTLMPAGAGWTDAVEAALATGRRQRPRISTFSPDQFAHAWVGVIEEVAGRPSNHRQCPRH